MNDHDRINDEAATALHARFGSDWLDCAVVLPPPGVLVDTKIDDADGVRNEQPLKRQGSLWFVADGSMYVYYLPTHWRAIAPVPRDLIPLANGRSVDLGGRWTMPK
jgi:hypothetical protein